AAGPGQASPAPGQSPSRRTLQGRNSRPPSRPRPEVNDPLAPKADTHGTDTAEELAGKRPGRPGHVSSQGWSPGPERAATARERVCQTSMTSASHASLLVPAGVDPLAGRP